MSKHVSITPNHSGMARAWHVDVAAKLKAVEAKAAGGDAEAKRALADAGEVANWVIEAPWAHMAWHSYVLFCVHLRDIPGQSQPPIRKFEGATHEVQLFAMDPRADREAIIKGELVSGYLLTPQNYVGQFVAAHDAAAAERVNRAVVDICAGVLSPDTDFRRQWFARFGDHFYVQGKAA